MIAKAGGFMVTDDYKLLEVDELPNVTEAEVLAVLDAAGVVWSDLFLDLD